MAVLVFFLNIMGRLVADEIKAWLPKLTEWTLQHSVSQLPSENRERYREEWEADLLGFPSDVSKFARCLGFRWAAWQMEMSCLVSSKIEVMRHRKRQIAWRVFVGASNLQYWAVTHIPGAKGGDTFTYISQRRPWRKVSGSYRGHLLPYFHTALLDLAFFVKRRTSFWLE